MKIGLITIGAVSSLVCLTAVSQNQTGVSQPTPPTPPTPPTTLPSGIMPRQQMAPGLPNRSQTPAPVGRSNLVPNTAGTNGMSTPVQSRARTASDQALLVRLQQTVQTSFRGAGASPWAPLRFDVDDGVVTLLGRVPNAATEEQLEALVQQVPGVTGVVDQLAVGRGPTPQAGSTEDEGLLLRIRQSVLPQIEVAGTPAPIQFNVQQGGMVTISGTLPNIEQKRQVSALVRQVPGVAQVNNQVVVTGVAGTTANPNLPAGNQVPQGVSPGTAVNPATGTINNGLTPTGRGPANTLPPAASPIQTNAVPRMSR